MSAEFSSVPQTPDMSGKKKKAKGNTDNSVKKRKREQEEQHGTEAPAVSEPSKKKSKKAKQQIGDQSAVQQANAAIASNTGSAEQEDHEGTTNATGATPKNTKKQRKDAEGSAEAVQVTESATKRKKPRKPKSNAVPPTETLPTEAASIAPKDESEALTHVESKSSDVNDAVLQSQSPFVQETTSFYLALSPCAYDFPLEGLCAEHISPLLLTYYPPLKGVVLSYSNPRLSEHPDDEQRPHASSSREAKVVLSRSIDEYAVTYVWLTAEFTVLRPRQGTYLEGYVNLQNESILGLVCYNYFNAGIERSRMPKDWRWVGDDAELGKGKNKQEGEGYFVDGEGKKVDGRLAFRVKDFEATAGSEMNVGSINIYGTLLSEGDDRRLDDEERQRGLVA